MHCLFTLLSGIFFLLCQPLFAQSEKAISGVYNLKGVMETAAGFQLKPDYTFEYIFTYGAADKWGKGSWKLNGNTLILTSSHKQPTADFIIQKSDASYKNGVKIKISDAQGHFYPYIKGRLGGENGENVTTDEKGEAIFKDRHNGMLELYHPIYSLRVTQIQLKPIQTNFLIYPASDLSEVFFNDLQLEVSKDQIVSTQLPGMPAEDAAGQLKRYVFQKQK